MQRHKAIVLIIVGVILAILGFLIGNNILPKALQRKMKTMVCVDSQQSENYRSWVCIDLIRLVRPIAVWKNEMNRLISTVLR